MATNKTNHDKVEIFRKTEVKTTYEYVSVLGGLLGYWRKSSVQRMGDDLEIHIRGELKDYDRLLINGKEIPIESIL